MAFPFTRVISDLHYRNCASSVQRLDQIEPLVANTPRVIFNGDTLDEEVPERTAEALTELRGWIAGHVAEPVVLAGNHDIELSEQGECTLLDGRIWITHGDVLFPDIIPWSSHLAVLRPRLERFYAEIPAEERNTIETRLRATRATCHDLGREYDVRVGGWRGRLARLAAAVSPPTRILTILKTWQATPGLAAELATTQRPSARFILIGHTHRAGVWQIGGRCVINTGSFCPPHRPLVVDLDGETIRVRSVRRRGDQFHPGPVRAEFPLFDPSAA